MVWLPQYQWNNPTKYGFIFYWSKIKALCCFSCLPVSVSKLTVAWKRLPCISTSNVSFTSGLSCFSWMRRNALSRFSQKLISCSAVPEAGSRSSLVTCTRARNARSSHLQVKPLIDQPQERIKSPKTCSPIPDPVHNDGFIAFNIWNTDWHEQQLNDRPPDFWSHCGIPTIYTIH